MTDTGLPTETCEGFCLWHPLLGFDMAEFEEDEADVVASPTDQECGWRILPVTITITATAAVGGRRLGCQHE